MSFAWKFVFVHPNNCNFYDGADYVLLIHGRIFGAQLIIFVKQTKKKIGQDQDDTEY